MKLISATNLHRKSGVAERRDLRFSQRAKNVHGKISSSTMKEKNHMRFTLAAALGMSQIAQNDQILSNFTKTNAIWNRNSEALSYPSMSNNLVLKGRF